MIQYTLPDVIASASSRNWPAGPPKMLHFSFSIALYTIRLFTKAFSSSTAAAIFFNS
jgi:hypothetical protein